MTAAVTTPRSARPDVGSFGVPARAAAAWRALSRALLASGPARCEDAIDPELWWQQDGGGVDEAKAVCGRCPVRVACAAFAMAAGERHGIWGGLTPKERADG